MSVYRAKTNFSSYKLGVIVLRKFSKIYFKMIPILFELLRRQKLLHNNINSIHEKIMVPLQIFLPCSFQNACQWESKKDPSP